MLYYIPTVSLAIPAISNVAVTENDVILSWALQEKDGVTQYEVECSSVNHVSRHVVNNKTFSDNVGGLLPSTDYNCCISAVFSGHSTESCVPVRTGEVAGCAAGNVDAVGGILGFIVIILFLLLIVAILAIVYPFLIRPRVQKSKTMSRYTIYNCM